MEPEIKIHSTIVTAQSPKLKAQWSFEVAQDITAFFGMNFFSDERIIKRLRKAGIRVAENLA